MYVLSDLIKSNIVSAVVIGLPVSWCEVACSPVSLIGLPGCINITQNIPCKTAIDVVAA